MAHGDDKDEPIEHSAEVTDVKNEPETPAPEAEPAGKGSEVNEQSETDKKPTTATAAPHTFKQLLNTYWSKKKWTLPVTALAIILIVLAIPLTRYATLGLFLKGTVTVSLVDSTTHTPVSSAAVTVGGHSEYTNADGKVTFRQKLGGKTLSITKQYYKTSTQKVTVTFSKKHNSFKYSLVANGRQVPITITNKVTGKPIAGAEIVVLSPHATASKTDKNGKATIVLPTKTTSQKASISGAGFNALQTTVQITSSDVAANHFSLTPSGKLYFLSNQSGKIDVVKTNLDGSDRQTVLAGTGSEDPNSTSLLASRDWKYLALLAKRSGNTASVYLIDTSNDKLTTIDEGNASFSLVGWSDDTFNYEVFRNGVQNWQPNAQALKSYNAASGKLTTLDQTQGEGSSIYDYGYTNFSSVYILDNELVYTQNWYSSYYNNHLSGKNVSLISVKPDGSSRKVVKDFPIPNNVNYYYVNLSLYEPYGVYVQVPSSDNSGNTYYEYEDGKLAQKPDVTDTTFNQGYATYLISPSDKQTFWSDQRDGKNALFVGDADAKNQKQIASLSEYQTYGWYTDNYLLVSKNASELYIMAADGSSAPQKISDYYKPPTTYRGYGGGYGGL